MNIRCYYFFFAVVFLCSMISSCEKEEDKLPTSVMVGSWKEISIEYFSCPNTSDNDLDECAPTNSCDTWQFNADGTFKQTTSSGLVATGTYYTHGGNKFNLCYTACTEHTFSVSANILTITEVTVGNECVTRYKYTKI